MRGLPTSAMKTYAAPPPLSASTVARERLRVARRLRRRLEIGQRFADQFPRAHRRHRATLRSSSMEDANSAAIGHDDDRLSEAKRGHFAILRARAINLIPTLPHL